MTISEKSAYLKGLMDGLKLNTESDEGKMIAAIVDLLGDVTKKVVDIEDTTIAISDELDEIEEDLDAIEDYILDEDEDDENHDARPGGSGEGVKNRMIPMMAWIYTLTAGISMQKMKIPGKCGKFAKQQKGRKQWPPAQLSGL